MLNHPFMRALAAMQQALDAALLECHTIEQGLEFDLLLGDVLYETSYALPGEGLGRISCDLSFEWSTWSQTAFRSWTIGEEPNEPPEVMMVISLHARGLAAAPDVPKVLGTLPTGGPPQGPYLLERKSPTMEQSFEEDGTSRYGLEVTYEGVYEVPERAFDNPERIDEDMAPLGAWVASTLVKLTDVGFEFLPPDIDLDAP
jgi:hypothetical protein